MYPVLCVQESAHAGVAGSETSDALLSFASPELTILGDTDLVAGQRVLEVE